MSPEDITEIAREFLPEHGFASYDQLNPVPIDRLTGGHLLFGIELTSDPDVNRWSMWVDGEFVEEF